LTAACGSAQILNGINLKLGAKEVVAPLGRNGVGQTTLLKSIMGIVPAAGGSVAFLGSGVSKLPTYQIAKSGIGYVPQGRGTFDKLTVEENLRIGLQARREPSDEIPSFTTLGIPRSQCRLMSRPSVRLRVFRLSDATKARIKF
jgi:ABC-type branched-subunit amino acid transport system ATPase component